MSKYLNFVIIYQLCQNRSTILIMSLRENSPYENISISPNNNIGRVSELDEISAYPVITDEEIKKRKEKKEYNEAINDLGNVADYYQNNFGVNI